MAPECVMIPHWPAFVSSSAKSRARAPGPNCTESRVRASQEMPWQKNLPVNTGDAGDAGSVPGLGRPPGGGSGNPHQYSCLEDPHGQWSLAGYRPRGHKELDTTEHA